MAKYKHVLRKVTAPSDFSVDYVTRRESRESIDSLALTLAKNYFDTSRPITLGSDGKDEDTSRQSLAARVFKDAEAISKRPRPERTILIVGSGASLATFGPDQFPGTYGAIKQIQENLGLDPGGVARKLAAADDDMLGHLGVDRKDLEKVLALPSTILKQIDDKKEQLKQAYSFHDASNDFETNLALLGEIFSQRRVTEELAAMFGERFQPHLAFEVIAHLFKHRFIDVIINFNFDELLDQAIVEEMGTTEYHNVISDGDCRRLGRMLVSSRLKIPLYIKPHGTVSHKSSMRFTKDHYFQLPAAMRGLMHDVIGGHWLDEGKRANGYLPYHVNIVSLGFAMKSVDLLSILQSVARDPGQQITMYHLNVARGRKEFAELATSQGWDELGVKQHHVAVDTDGLASTMSSLWTQTKSHFTASFRPRGIARHEVVHEIFFSAPGRKQPGKRLPAARPVEESRGDSYLYFKARIYTELALALARGNGQIDLMTLANGRVGRYFDLLRDCRDAEDISVHTLLKPFAHGGTVELTGPDQSIFSMKLAQRSDWESRGITENLPDLANRELAERLWNGLYTALSTIGDDDFAAHIKGIAESREKTEATGTGKKVTKQEAMIGRLTRLASSDGQDINPSFRHSHLLLSHEPMRDDVLHTGLGLTLRFVEMSNMTWDLMVVVSEYGKVLGKFMDHCESKNIRHRMEDKRFCVIVADSDYAWITRERLKRYSHVLLKAHNDEPYFSIPAATHNQHMVVLVQREGWKPVAAIRYEKVGLGNRVNPIYIKERATTGEAKDLDAALACFKRYLHMSRYGVPGAAPSPSRSTSETSAGPVPSVEEHWLEVVGQM